MKLKYFFPSPVCLAAFALASIQPARAGQYFQDFSAFPVGATNFGDGSTLSSMALGTVTSVQDSTYKELQLTPYFTGVRSAFLLPDLDPGTPVNAFSVKWNADFYGNGAESSAFGDGMITA
jgi:hypothetical protein